MDFGVLGANDVHPATLPDLFAGDQLLTAGRFTHPGSAHVRLTGMVGTTPLKLEEDVVFPDTNRTWLAVGRYWGAQKIQSILDLIKIVGEKPELVSQVISLSIKYSVLTPYTAFLIVEPSSAGGTTVDDQPQQPGAFRLWQNFPNPFNPSTTITYELPSESYVTLKVYNTMGEEVATLVDGNIAAGVYTVKFYSSHLASGMYFYRLTAGSFVDTKKLIVLN